MKTHFINNLFFLLYSLFLLIHLDSCKKNSNNINQPKIHQEKDSSLLIKSIQYATNLLDTYDYDTINNKIIITSKYDNGGNIKVIRSELSYNENHLLTGIIQKYKRDISLDTIIVLSVKIDYDGQSILQKIESRDFYDSIKSTVFDKTLLASGNYELSWLEPAELRPDGAKQTQIFQAVFNDSGQLITKIDNYPYSKSGLRDDTSTSALITIDSFVYDYRGSLIKVLTNYVDTFRNINDNYTYYQFTSRFSTGDNLYNQREMLMRGISNIPFGVYVISNDAGVLSIFNGLESFEYSKYPFQTIVIHDYMNNYDFSFDPLTEFDSKGRLVYFKGFTLFGERPTQDQVPYAIDYRITYYK